MFRRLLKKFFLCGARSRSFGDKIVRKGSIRVCVGQGDDVHDLCKFEVEAYFLNHPLFENLLSLSKEKFGYSYNGALRMACDIDLFLFLIHLLKSNNPVAHYMELQQLVDKFCCSDAHHKMPSR